MVRLIMSENDSASHNIVSFEGTTEMAKSQTV